MTARRRPNSIGADEARAWARQIRLGNPYAKSILMAIANYVNEDGTAYPGIETIANDTDINADTVLRRERWLEDIGAIALSKCWVDENGRRNKDGRGRPTSSEIRFLFDADIDSIEAAARSDEPKALRGAAKKAHDDRASTRPGGEQNSTQEQEVSPPLATEQHPIPAPPPIYESSKGEDSHPTLPSGGLEEKSDSKTDQETEARWQQFKIGYPDGIVDPTAAHAEFVKLSEVDQLGAIAGLAVYASRLKARREKSLKAHLYVRKRTWDGMLASAPAGGSLVTAGPYDQVSEVGRALLALSRIAGKSCPRSGDGRLIYPRPITPQLLALANAKFTVFDGYANGSRNFFAWSEFIRAHVTNAPRQAVIFAPWPWPPSAEGKIYDQEDSESTGPPDRVPGTLATDEDLNELARG